MKFLKAALVLLFVFAASAAFAQTPSAELKKQRDRLNEELDELNHEYQETLNNKKSTLKQLNLLKAQINLREDKIKTINSEVRLLDNEISQSNNSVRNLQSQLAQLKKQYAAMVLFAYRNQSAYNKLMFLFASKDFNQAYKRLTYLQQFGSYRERQANYIQGTETELHVKINELDRNKKEKSSLLADQEKEKEMLGKQRNDQVQVVDNLSKQAGQIKEQQREVLKKKARTERELSAAIRREIEEARRKAEEAEKARLAAERARAAAENKTAAATTAPAKLRPAAKTTSEILNATPEAARLSNDFLGNKGRLPWPVANGVVTQGFGIYYIEGIKSESTGFDIRTNPNANVRAVFEGEVTQVLNTSGTYLVIVKHGEYFTAYSNLRSASVSRGQKISTKQIVGTAATDPASGETIVHFDLLKGLTYVNPAAWLAPSN